MSVTDVVKDPQRLTMTLTAQYDVSAERAWRLWDDPRQLERWWGPPTYPATVVEHDLTPGGSVTYYMTDFTAGAATIVPRQFPGPSGAWELASSAHTDCCDLTGGRCPGGADIWTTDPVWAALKFSIPDSHTYMPGYSGDGQGIAALFTAYARGNLDCDSVPAEFSRQGGVTNNGDVSGSVQPLIVNELE